LINLQFYNIQSSNCIDAQIDSVNVKLIYMNL